MTFVSYAQNYEDVMLWRALKHIERGFYIDIGAAWPDEHSVTKAFYKCGWHGVNIEPNPELYLLLQAHRPHDTNLRIAIGDREGVLAMNFLGDTGLSTLDYSIAERHKLAGLNTTRQEVLVSTLAATWERYVPTDQAVHFLKVDVEGFEEAALRGNNWSRYRPWIVVVESTLPMSQVEAHETWEPVLLNTSYRFAYADGLNRFYVAEEHSELLPALKYPPNVFDDFCLSRQQVAEARATQAEARATQAEARATQAEARATQAEARATQAEARATQAEARATQAEAMLRAVYISRSWQLTRPLRNLADLLSKYRLMVFKKLPLLPVITAQVVLRRTVAFVNASPRRNKRIVDVIWKLGLYNVTRSLYTKLISIAHRAQATGPCRVAPADEAHLTPRAREIYIQLNAAIERSRKATD